MSQWSKIKIVENLTASFFIGLVLFLAFMPFSNIDFYADSLKTITAWKIPDASGFSYWLSIYTNPIHGPQYRPTSFFTYFFIMGSLFGDNPKVYFLAALLMLYATCTLLFFFLRTIGLNHRSSLLAAILFGLHGNHLLFLTESSHSLKYYGPVIGLLALLISAVKNPPSLKKTIVQSFVLLFLLTIHEASFVFFAIVLMFTLLYQRLERHHLLLPLPMLLWLYFRLVHWKLPDDDAQFSTDFSLSIIEKITFFMDYSFQFFYRLPLIENHYQQFQIHYLLSLAIFAVCFFISFRKKKIVVAIAITGFACLSPFTVMKDHVYATRVLWASCFWMPIVSVSFFTLVNFCAKKLPFLYPQEKIKTAFTYLTVATIGFILISTKIDYPTATNLGGDIENYNTQFLAKIDPQDSNSWNRVFLGGSIDSYIKHTIFPGAVARKFTDRKIVFEFNLDKRGLLVLVKDGVYYRAQIGRDGSIYSIEDPFQQKVSLKEFEFDWDQVQTQTFQVMEVQL